MEHRRSFLRKKRDEGGVAVLATLRQLGYVYLRP